MDILESLRKVILEDINQTLEMEKKVRDIPMANARIQVKLEILQGLMLWVTNSQKEGKADMDKLKKELFKDVVKLEDILAHRREGVLEPEIIEKAKALKVGDAVSVDIETIKIPHFIVKVSKMKRKGLLPDNVRAIQSKGQAYLAKFPEEKVAK